uniref:Fms related receptor tyrosine kinase 1 n=1 Tax=Pongo abelii TaxID=9601 RepID=A0A8I5UYK2_PONAB
MHHRMPLQLLCASLYLATVLDWEKLRLSDVPSFPHSNACPCLTRRQILLLFHLNPGLRVTSKSKESGLSDVSRPSFCHSSCGHISEGKRRFTYDNAELERKIACCSPPPDYNSVVLYSTPPI